MTEKEVFVYVELEGTSHQVGRLWPRTRKGRDSATFEYHKHLNITKTG